MGDKHSTSKILATIMVALVALATGTAAMIVRHTPRAAAPPAVASAPPATSGAPSVKASSTDRIAYDGQAGQTALALLKQHATVATKDSPHGPYVDSINGIVNGKGGKYWSFYVNGTLAQVSAGAYITKSGDKIQWKFE